MPNKKLRKDQPTSLPFNTQAEKDAAENLETLMTYPPRLALARATTQYTVDTGS